MRDENRYAKGFGAVGAGLTILGLDAVFQTIGFSPAGARFLIGGFPAGLGVGVAVDYLLRGTRWYKVSPHDVASGVMGDNESQLERQHSE